MDKNKTEDQIKVEELLRAEDEILAMQGKARPRMENKEDRLWDAFMKMDTYQLLSLQDCYTGSCELSELYQILSDSTGRTVEFFIPPT